MTDEEIIEVRKEEEIPQTTENTVETPTDKSNQIEKPTEESIENVETKTLPHYTQMTPEEFNNYINERRKSSRDSYAASIETAIEAGNKFRDLDVPRDELRELGFSVNWRGKIVKAKDDSALAQLVDVDGDGAHDKAYINGVEFTREGFNLKEGQKEPEKKSEKIEQDTDLNNNQFYKIVTDDDYELSLKLRALQELSDDVLSKIALNDIPYTAFESDVRVAAVQSIRDVDTLSSTLQRTMKDHKGLCGLLSHASRENTRREIISRLNLQQMQEFISLIPATEKVSFYKDIQQAYVAAKKAAARVLLDIKPEDETEEQRAAVERIYFAIKDNKVSMPLRLKALDKLSERNTNGLYALVSDTSMPQEIQLKALERIDADDYLAKVVQTHPADEVWRQALEKMTDPQKIFEILLYDLNHGYGEKKQCRINNYLQIDISYRTNLLGKLSIPQLKGLEEQLSAPKYQMINHAGLYSGKKIWSNFFNSVEALIKQKTDEELKRLLE